MMKSLFITVVIGLWPGTHRDQQKNFSAFEDKFVKEYTALKIPGLELPYVSDIKDIKSADSVDKEIHFFNAAKKKLAGFTAASLNPVQQQDYLQIRYETDMNLQRLSLEKQWLASKPDSISTKGIYTLPGGKKWYAYLLKRWLTDEVTPDQIYQFGLQEVKSVKEHIEQIRLKTGLSEADFYRHLNSPAFFINDPVVVQRLFQNTKNTVYHNLHKVFYPHNLPALTIKRGESRMLAQTPGYYDSNTFYYNLFDKPYNIRQIDWLFIHEGVPGHHYQISIYSAQKHTKVQALFTYMCYAEGWACYTEELGKDIGLYKTPYAELGKWEWDIVRAVRIPMDIGLNYYGWTDAQALAFWKKNIRNQDDIALREIARVKRWPVQAISYNYGAWRIKLLKQAMQKKQGDKFNIRDFHERILNSGFLPWFMVERNVMKIAPKAA
ncbi:MAG: DUF885 domain-containing protein [Mucilaginibacter sp.]